MNKPDSNRWRRDVVIITTEQIHPTKTELSFCTGGNTVYYELEICDVASF